MIESRGGNALLVQLGAFLQVHFNKLLTLPSNIKGKSEVDAGSSKMGQDEARMGGVHLGLQADESAIGLVILVKPMRTHL